MRSEWKSRTDRQLRWCLHREPRVCSQGSLEQPQRHFEAQMPLKNQVALEPSELEVSTTQQQDTGAGRLLSPLHEGDQARGALWLASPGQRKQLWLGSGLGWVRELGWLWISPYPISLSIYFTFLRRNRAWRQHEKWWRWSSPSLRLKASSAAGIHRARARAASPRASDSFLANQKPVPGAPEASSPHPACRRQGQGAHLPPPSPTRFGLWIPLEHSQVQMSGGSCAIGGDGRLFQGLIKLERRMGGPEAGKHRPSGGPRPPARPPGFLPSEPRISRCCRAGGRLILFSNTKLLPVAQRFKGLHFRK